MSSSANLGLPFVQASQAQKHVTVNEGLSILDAVAQLVIASTSETTPPVDATEGAVYAIPTGAQLDWVGHVGELAFKANGGWQFVSPKFGWRARLAEQGIDAVFDGVVWRPNQLGAAPSGAVTDLQPIEFDHTIIAGSDHLTSAVIPANTLVLGITGRVVSGFTGTASSWRLGVQGADNRYGSGLGLAQNSYVLGMTGTPLAYYVDTPLQITAEGGDLSAGAVRFVLHTLRLGIPDLV